MADRKEYTVTIAGIEHTMLLDKEDAARLAAVEVKVKAPANKAATPANK